MLDRSGCHSLNLRDIVTRIDYALNTAIRNTARVAREILVYMVLCMATLSILLTISQYTRFRDDAAFLQYKQEYLHIRVWKTAFYIHVFSAFLALMAGFTQFSNYVLKYHRPLHRVLGKLYAYDILLVNFPAALIMAWYANGEWPSRLAFFILDSLWFAFTLKAVLAIRKKDIRAHRRFMIRSYALTLSAITLRTWKIILSGLFVIDIHTLYQIDAWMGFVPNLLLAEWLIRKKIRNVSGAD